MDYSNIPDMMFSRDETLVLALIAAFMMNAAVNLFRESVTANKLGLVAEEVRELNYKLEGCESDTESDTESEAESEPEFYQPFTFEFACGSYAHYFEDPDYDFVLVLPEDTLRGDSIIEASIGHVTRSNPHGSPIITYIDFDGCRATYVLPEYAGRRFCEFINSHV